MEKITISKIAHASGASPQTLSNILNGRRRPSWALSQRLEVSTGISAVKWISGKVTKAYLNKKIFEMKNGIENV